MAKKKTAQQSTRQQRTGTPSKENAAGSVHSPPSEAEASRPVADASAGLYIVGIGASAGGLEAFEQFFKHMPPDSGMAFILIPHLDPTHKSMLADLLQRYTKMEIFQAEDGMKVQPNRVYIIPPNKDMSLLHGTLQLLEPVERRGLRHPIDYFFRSLAADQGERSICVVLSGTGTEGALGLKAVKGEGGLVLVQDLKTAKYDGMPATAIATGLVDYVLPAHEMPGQLLTYIKRPYARPLMPAESSAGKALEHLQKIFVLIRAHTGNDFSLYKQSTILRRIEKRMAIHQVERLADYVMFLRGNPSEIEALFRELLIRVTSFFRDPDAFEVLKTTFLPQLLKNRPADAPLRVWVPGCSTGEEAYSLAIVVHEYLHTLKKNIKFQIFATDIDSSAVETARAGVYAEGLTADVSSERLARYFIKKGSSYKVRDETREMIVFAVQNLVKDPPFSKIDMISCRNLLIYLSATLQKKVLPLFSYAMRPGGILFLGSSETIGDHADLFSVLDKKWKIFKVKRSSAAPVLADLRSGAPFDAGAKTGRTIELKKPDESGIVASTERLLLEAHTPACVIADEKGDILYFHGRTGAFLEPAAGKARLNVVDMARDGLRLELRMAIRKTVAGEKSTLFKGLRVRAEGIVRTVNLEVKYLRKPEHLRGLVMVLFHELQQTKTEKAASARAHRPVKTDRRITELELELKSTKDHLQSTIEQLETTNEELKSTNEELQSSNEELQSTNEEMETSKEELQSMNEELMTVNAELQGKLDELSEANSDMINLLAGTRIATLFLSSDLRIRRFTPTATDIINLIDGDVGRPISDIVSKLEYPDLVQDAEEVLRTLVPKEKDVRSKNGRWYLVRVMPYRTITNVINGVVITFVDVTRQKESEGALQEALLFSENIVETVREPLLVLDGDLRVKQANKAFYEAFGLFSGAVENRLIYELGEHQWDIPSLRELLEKVLPEKSQFRDFVVESEFSGIGRRKVLLNARTVVRQDSSAASILLAMEDVTNRSDQHE